jgi:hypothetical protein
MQQLKTGARNEGSSDSDKLITWSRTLLKLSVAQVLANKLQIMAGSRTVACHELIFHTTGQLFKLLCFHFDFE